MNKTTPFPELSPSQPARRVAEDGRDNRAPDPARHFASPDLLAADANLTDSEKVKLLQEWATDVDRRLNAEEEGMGASDPLRSEQEGRLAAEAAQVQSCLAALIEKTEEK
jgi:hypothetical protein